MSFLVPYPTWWTRLSTSCTIVVLSSSSLFDFTLLFRDLANNNLMGPIVGRFHADLEYVFVSSRRFSLRIGLIRVLLLGTSLRTSFSAAALMLVDISISINGTVIHSLQILALSLWFGLIWDIVILAVRECVTYGGKGQRPPMIHAKETCVAVIRRHVLLLFSSFHWPTLVKTHLVV